MSYIKGIYQYLSVGKGKLDIIDYLRATMVILAAAFIIRAAFFIACNWLNLG